MADSISPVFAPDVIDINRRRALADALIKQGISTPETTQFAGGAAVKNSPVLGIANLLAAALGASQKKKADDDYTKALSGALSGIQSPAPQISSTPMPAAPAAPDNSIYNDPNNPTGVPAPQISNTPTQAAPAPQPQGMGQGVTMQDIQRLRQFPELAGQADMLQKQMEAQQKFNLEQQGAIAADERSRKTHEANRLFDVNNPTDKTPATVQEYEYAKNQGFKGSLADWIRQQKTTVAQFHLDNPTPAAPVDPQDVEVNAQAIAKGQLPPLTGLAARSPRAAQIMARVLEINPDYRGTDYGTHAAAEKFFTSGKGGNTMRSLDVAHSHLESLGNLVDALNNGDIQLLNKAKNIYQNQTGGTAPGNFDAAKRIVTDEVAKAIIGGATALGDREEAAASINNAKSPAQLKQIIDTYQELMRGQINGLANQYQSSTGRTDFYNRFKLDSTPSKNSPNAGGWSITPVH